ncbi:MAG: hypothetical protein KBE01_06370 [Synergistaceae bacterium]|nr:hypothetical protein [Synergistaceae bacterium]
MWVLGGAGQGHAAAKETAIFDDINIQNVDLSLKYIDFKKYPRDSLNVAIYNYSIVPGTVGGEMLTMGYKKDADAFHDLSRATEILQGLMLKFASKKEREGDGMEDYGADAIYFIADGELWESFGGDATVVSEKDLIQEYKKLLTRAQSGFKKIDPKKYEKAPLWLKNLVKNKDKLFEYHFKGLLTGVKRPPMLTIMHGQKVNLDNVKMPDVSPQNASNIHKMIITSGGGSAR